ncbi:MAG: hypothetical protein WD431_26670 [Cyclobacteriaceae bacterium]
MRSIVLIFVAFLVFSLDAKSQNKSTERSTVYFLGGTSGSNIREFNEMLQNKGISPLRGGYTTFGLGYQYRFNDFIVGFELYQNNGSKSIFRGYHLDSRTTRFFANVGYSLTEEGRFHLVHYMSLGVGYLNFQMLKDERKVEDLGQFLENPAQGFVLRKNDIQKGSENFGSFLTEIGFQFGYDFELPGLEETVGIMGKFGYSFSPFEDSWRINGTSFDNLQSGAFFRIGTDISMPSQNLFFPDAGLGIHIFYGLNFKSPNALNEMLEEHGYQPFDKIPGNFGLKVIGENRRRVYAIDIFNISNKATGNEAYTQTLNSVRVYGNYGYLLYKRRNLELGTMGGIGYGNIRYTLENNFKPDFPRLFEDPDFDGYLSNQGLMAKPEVFISYSTPIIQRKFRLVYSVHSGYEIPLSRYRLGELAMANYLSGPYIQFGLGFRP